MSDEPNQNQRENAMRWWEAMLRSTRQVDPMEAAMSTICLFGYEAREARRDEP